ncbi:MAG: DUF5689 domain-containing protein [Alistipes sp.]|nr:DUF5689 domain-containing protein [Alistipes sp.]
MCRSKSMISLLAILCVTAACDIRKNPFTDEPGDGIGDQDAGVVSIAYLKSLYVNRPVTIDRELTVKGRVTSSDRYGNFYKTVYIEDESGAIALRVDMIDYYRTFRLGYAVTLYCNNLTLGTYGGAVYLGISPPEGSTDVGYIPEDYIFSYATLSDTGQEPPAAETDIPLQDGSWIHRSVVLTGVQFVEYGATWCETDSDTNRTLIDRDGNRLSVRTSRYAEFTDHMLPHGSGSIRGIVGYFNGEYQLTVISDQYAVMEGDRF